MRGRGRSRGALLRVGQSVGARLEFPEFAHGLLAARNHLVDRPAVFAFERLDQVGAVLEFAQGRRIRIDPLGISPHFRSQISQPRSRCFHRPLEVANARVEARHFPRGAHRPGQQTAGAALAVCTEDRLQLSGQLEQTMAVSRRAQAGHEVLLLSGAQLGGGNLFRRVGEHFPPHRGVFFQRPQTCGFVFPADFVAVRSRIIGCRRRGSGKGIEDARLGFP